jgi:hypothetical protein
MDVDKTMEFILEHQAALTAGRQQLQAELAQLEKVTARHSRELEVHTEEDGDEPGLQELATQTKDAFMAGEVNKLRRGRDPARRSSRRPKRRPRRTSTS